MVRIRSPLAVSGVRLPLEQSLVALITMRRELGFDTLKRGIRVHVDLVAILRAGSAIDIDQLPSKKQITRGRQAR